NQREIGSGRFHLLAIVDPFADAHVDDHFLDHRNLHAVLVAVLLGELLAHHLFEIGPQPRRHTLLWALTLGLLAGVGLLAAAFVALVAAALGLLRLLALVALLGLGPLRRPFRLGFFV